MLKCEREAGPNARPNCPRRAAEKGGLPPGATPADEVKFMFDTSFDYNSEMVDRLCEALMSLKTTEEYRAFLADVCTIGEVQDLAQRLTAALLLSQGKSYQQICAELGVSTATISRVNRCLNYGAGGYKIVLARLDGEGGGNK